MLGFKSCYAVFSNTQNMELCVRLIETENARTYSHTLLLLYRRKHNCILPVILQYIPEIIAVSYRLCIIDILKHQESR